VTLAVSDEELRVVRRILTSIVPNAEYLAFGSRLHRGHHRYSDLDIAIKAASKLSLQQLSALEEAFAESDLPFRVDIVDLYRASPEFRRLVQGNHVKI
jgi:predicted nucleotidyltransferase